MTPEEVRTAADQLPVAIWMGKVPSGEVVYVNGAFREILGIEPPEGAGRGAFVEPYGVHLPDGSRYPENKMPFERVIESRAMVVVDDIVIHRRDGRKVSVRVFAKPLFDEAGNLTHVLEAFIDISREVEAVAARASSERRLARSQRLESIGQLVAGIAHDFNNLLTVTKLIVARLSPGEADNERRRSLRDIDMVTESAANLIQRLLEFGGRTRADLAPIEIDSVVESVVYLATRTFDRRISVSSDLRARSVSILGDRTRIEQVFMNLLVNARDAMEIGGGSIHVTTRQATFGGDDPLVRPGNYVVCEVNDTGPGIPLAIRERVFEPYFTTKDMGTNKGTGLGLSTVHGIVKSHGGVVEIADHEPHGTTMRVMFPITGSPSAHVSARPGVPAPRGDNELVLLVEDDALVRQTTARTMRKLGYEVLEAADAAEAVALFNQNAQRVSAVVLDLVVPGASAHELYRSMCAIRPNLPAMVITGAAIEHEVERLLSLGVSNIVSKPFSAEALATSLRGILER